jgi:hypothetical protein
VAELKQQLQEARREVMKAREEVEQERKAKEAERDEKEALVAKLAARGQHRPPPKHTAGVHRVHAAVREQRAAEEDGSAAHPEAT